MLFCIVNADMSHIPIATLVYYRHRASTQLSMTWYEEDKTVNIVPRFKM